MSDPKFKPLTLEDFSLSKDDIKTLVEGAQKFLPPQNDESESGESPISPVLTSDH